MRQVLLVLAVVMATAAATPKVRRQADNTDYSPCNGNLGVCVPYYLCNEGNIITDGAGLIDIRIGDPDSQPIRSTSECPNFLDVCCNKPETAVVTPDLPPYTPSCGRHNPYGIHVRITGEGIQDTQTQFGEVPWMAAVLRQEVVGVDSVNVYKCGGSLIHPSVVLTAAHCVYGENVDDLVVRLGEWDTQGAEEILPHQNIYVTRMKLHEQFNPSNLHNDYALLFLEKPATLTHNVDTICLPHYDEKLKRTNCFASGWGKDRFGQEGLFQNVLKKIGLNMVGSAGCQDKLRSTRLGHFFKLHDSFTCAGGEAGVDTCVGDGGSPLVCESATYPGVYFQTGIVAWGIGCGEYGIPATYADVAKASKWITYNADKNLLELGYYIPDYWN